MSILDNFDVVSVPRTFSIAEVRILKNRISFNLSTASEIGYPTFVRLFLSRDRSQIALQPCERETPNAMRFFTTEMTDQKGKYKKRCISIGNKALTTLLKAGIHCDMSVPLRAPGVRFAEDNVIIFDLNQSRDERTIDKSEETGLCVRPVPAYPFATLPSTYFAN